MRFGAMTFTVLAKLPIEIGNGEFCEFVEAGAFSRESDEALGGAPGAEGMGAGGATLF